MLYELLYESIDAIRSSLTSTEGVSSVKSVSAVVVIGVLFRDYDFHAHPPEELDIIPAEMVNQECCMVVGDILEKEFHREHKGTLEQVYLCQLIRCALRVFSRAIDKMPHSIVTYFREVLLRAVGDVQTLQSDADLLVVCCTQAIVEFLQLAPRVLSSLASGEASQSVVVSQEFTGSWPRCSSAFPPIRSCRTCCARGARRSTGTSSTEASSFDRARCRRCSWRCGRDWSTLRTASRRWLRCCWTRVERCACGARFTLDAEAGSLPPGVHLRQFPQHLRSAHRSCVDCRRGEMPFAGGTLGEALQRTLRTAGTTLDLSQHPGVRGHARFSAGNHLRPEWEQIDPQRCLPHKVLELLSLLLLGGSSPCDHVDQL